jgi:hypothetical protein
MQRSETRTSNRLVDSNANRATKTIAIASTPPVLFRIDLKIQYTIMKYHSGQIANGVTKLFAGILLSGWANKFGQKKN